MASPTPSSSSTLADSTIVPVAPMKRKLEDSNKSLNPSKRPFLGTSGVCRPVRKEVSLWNEEGCVLIDLTRGLEIVQARVTTESIGPIIQQVIARQKNEGKEFSLPENFKLALDETTEHGHMPMLIIDANNCDDDWIQHDNPVSTSSDLTIKEEPAEGKDIPAQALWSDHQVIQAYRQFLYILLGHAPSFDAQSAPLALRESEALISVSKNYECTSIVGAHIISHLTDFRQQLFISIAADPPRWLLLAIDLQSGFIYAEALTHMAGAHPAWPWATSKKSVPAAIHQTIRDKSARLNQKLIAVDRSLLMNTITYPDGGNTTKESPVTITSSVGAWHIVQFYRDNLVRQLHELEMLSAGKRALQRGKLYRQIGRGGDAYLPLEEVHKLIEELEGRAFAASDEAAEDLRMLKEYSKSIVRDVVKNCTMVDVEAGEIGYLTCVEVGIEDYLWWKWK